MERIDALDGEKVVLWLLMIRNCLNMWSRHHMRITRGLYTIIGVSNATVSCHLRKSGSPEFKTKIRSLWVVQSKYFWKITQEKAWSVGAYHKCMLSNQTLAKICSMKLCFWWHFEYVLYFYLVLVGRTIDSQLNTEQLARDREVLQQIIYQISLFN